MGFQTTEHMTVWLVTCTKKHTEIKSFRLAFPQLNYTLWNCSPAETSWKTNKKTKQTTTKKIAAVVLWLNKQETACCLHHLGKTPGTTAHTRPEWFCSGKLAVVDPSTMQTYLTTEPTGLHSPHLSPINPPEDTLDIRNRWNISQTSLTLEWLIPSTP